MCVCVFVAQPFLTLCDHMDGSLPGSSVHGILQARVLEWVAIFFSRGSFWPRDWTRVSCLAGRPFNWLSHQGSPILVYINNILLEFSMPESLPWSLKYDGNDSGMEN